MSLHVRFSLAVAFALLSISSEFCSSASAQSNNAATATVQDASKRGFPLSSSANVTDSVSVEAVLIPAKVAKTVFGKEISNNYAVISLTISNRSPDESFIVHSIFIDYSQWLLSGGSPVSQEKDPCLLDRKETKPSSPPDQSPKPLSGQNAPAAQESQQERQTLSKQPQPVPWCNPLQDWQQQTLGNQVDSVETRVVRGELLDRQAWTTRNWVLRTLQAAGSIATGFTFATSSQSWIRGIGAFNGVGIPAAQSLWPDATVGQMNRISDFGFQVNKVVAKQSSDIVVAFFPIDRFITPDLASIFISSPATFFAPFAALNDPKFKKRIRPYLDFMFPGTPEEAHRRADEEINNLKAHLYQVVTGQCSQDKMNTSEPPAQGTLARSCQTAEILNRLSLNVVRVRVGGTMTVDVNKVPPQIAQIDIDQDEAGSAKWQQGDTYTGVIRGSFLGNCTPIIKEENLGAVSAVMEGSSDRELHFKLHLNQNFPAGTTTLTFQVLKTSDSATITSGTHDYKIQTPPTVKPSGAGNEGIGSQQHKPTSAAPVTPAAVPASAVVSDSKKKR